MTQKLASSKGRLASCDNLYLVVQGSTHCFVLKAIFKMTKSSDLPIIKIINIYLCKYTENTEIPDAHSMISSLEFSCSSCS